MYTFHLRGLFAAISGQKLFGRSTCLMHRKYIEYVASKIVDVQVTLVLFLFFK